MSHQRGVPSTDRTSRTVDTDTATSHRPDLILAAFTTGGNAPHGETFVRSAGWRVIGEDTSVDDVIQPVLFDYKLKRWRRITAETMRYLAGSPTDNCAAIVVLH